MKKNTFFTIITLFCALITASFSADAQSKAFKMGQWTEIQSAILKELNTSSKALAHTSSLGTEKVHFL